MRKKWLVLCFFTLLFVPFSFAYANEDRIYIVSFKNAIDEQAIFSSGATIVDTLTHSPIAIVQADQKAFEKLKPNQSIETIEPSQKISIAAERANWGVDSIRAPQAWKTGYSGKGVKIAVIDTGVGPHEDLDIVESVSFIDSEPSTTDYNGHGTHIAGIIAALHNNIGVRGIAPEAEIYGLKVFNKNGDGYTHDVIRAIDWAIERQVDIINLSLTSEVPLASYEELINRAYQAGILIVGAAGNGVATDSTIDNVEYPAKFKNVIAVAAVDWDGNKGYYSSIGPAVEVAAPGVSIYSTYADNTYTYLQGTSMSTAFVTGHLALLKEAYPYLTNVQLRKKMIDDTIDLGPKGRDSVFGYGLIQSSSYRLPLYEYPATGNPAIGILFSHEGIQGYVGDTIDVHAKALLHDGQIVDISNFSEWTTVNDDLASSRNGRIDLHAEGETVLRVSYNGLSEELPIFIERDESAVPTEEILFTDLPKDYWAEEAIRDVYKKKIIKGYDDQTFKPNQPIQRNHAAVIIARTLPLKPIVPFSPFTDVHMYAPYYYEIMKTQQANIFTGNQHQFKPQSFLTRAQTAKIIVEAFQLPKAESSHPFLDVKQTHWADEYISTLYEAGVTTGSNGLYKPNAPVTRTQFAVFIHRTLNLLAN